MNEVEGLKAFIDRLLDEGIIGTFVHERLMRRVDRAIAEAGAAVPNPARYELVGLDSPAGAGADVEAERG